jgi:hemolysin activation/secretion protein
MAAYLRSCRLWRCVDRLLAVGNDLPFRAVSSPVALLALLLTVSAPAVRAQEAPAAIPADRGVPIDRFEFRYGLEHAELPALEEVGQVSVRLMQEDGVWRPVAGSSAGEIVTLASIPPGSRFDAAALRQVAQDLVRWYNSRDLYGVWVAFLDLESTSTGIADRRAADDRAARLVIWASQVAEVRTLARGKRFKPEASVNNRRHRGIVGHSPLQPATAEKPGSLFRQGVLNKYLQGLSQHPGRLVEASIASSGDPGKVVLDYLVNESRPWQVFGQVTNFGTEATGEWRSRLGFQHNQLTNHDDILNIDAITTPDFKTYGSFLSYRIPLIRPSLLVARVYGSYGDFLANDVAIQTLRFAGRNWLGGFELTNRFTLWDWQVASALGANYAHYGIESRIIETPLVTGFSNFLIPFASTTVSRDSAWWSLSGSLRYEQTVGNFANEDPSNGIPSLGRVGADAEWSSLRWSLGGSIYLEPLFAGGDTNAKFLASQLSMRVRGRFLLKGSRLIPHEQEPIGGAFSVRGYAESVLSADEYVTASVEYAFHFPRVLTPGPAGKFIKWPFKWRPARGRQEPDWDLIGRAFFDYAYRQVTPQKTGQTEEDLGLVDKTVSIAGAGGGLELQIKQNLSIRCDVGLSLTELRDDTREENEQIVVPAGEVRYYISSSFSW